MKERLGEFLKYLSVSQRQFELNCNLSNGFVDKVGDSIRTNNLNKISTKYPKLNINWLKTGEGEMLKQDEKSKSAVIKVPENNMDGIPLIPVNAMAGYMSGDVQVLEYECERYIVPMFREADFLIPVKGSSMIPKYNSGDLVACKKLPLNDLFFQWNKVYVIDTAQGPIVKRVKKGEDDDHVSIVSDNKQYDAFQLHKSQIRAVALVVGVIRLE